MASIEYTYVLYFSIFLHQSFSLIARPQHHFRNDTKSHHPKHKGRRRKLCNLQHVPIPSSSAEALRSQMGIVCQYVPIKYIVSFCQVVLLPLPVIAVQDTSQLQSMILPRQAVSLCRNELGEMSRITRSGLSLFFLFGPCVVK